MKFYYFLFAGGCIRFLESEYVDSNADLKLALGHFKEFYDKIEK
jgi:hypothetical protein